MSTSATNHLPHAGAAPAKGLNATLWVVQGLLALAFLAASSAKLLGRPEMVALFAAVGIGQWFRYVTGLLELTAAVLIVVPKTTGLGAALIVPIMLGAIATNLFIVHTPVAPPLLLLILATFVAWGRRQAPASVIRAVLAAGQGKVRKA
jgi:hypothetical protein